MAGISRAGVPNSVNLPPINMKNRSEILSNDLRGHILDMNTIISFDFFRQITDKIIEKTQDRARVIFGCIV